MSILVSHAHKRLYGVTEWVVSILQKLSLTRVWLCIVSQHVKINIVYETVPIFNMYHYWYFLNYPFCLFVWSFWYHKTEVWLANYDLWQVIYSLYISVFSVPVHKWNEITYVKFLVLWGLNVCSFIPSCPQCSLYFV